MIFAIFFDAQMKKYTFKSDKKRQYHREGRMSKAEVMMIMILFHSSGYRCFDNFMVNLLEAIAAYCFFPKKPTIRVQTVDCSGERQLTLF